MVRVGVLLLLLLPLGSSLQGCSNYLHGGEAGILIRSESASCRDWRCFYDHFASEINFSSLTVYANRTDAAEAISCSELKIDEMISRSEVLLSPEQKCPEEVHEKNATVFAPFFQDLRKCRADRAAGTVIFFLLTIIGIWITVNRVRAILFISRIPVVLHSTVVYRPPETHKLDRTQSVEDNDDNSKVPEHQCAKSILRFKPVMPVRWRPLDKKPSIDSEKNFFFTSEENKNLLDPKL
uniref:Transmembrane protein 156 n=1 Tax=Steinernema glaseri TaxID=37863 RepID=A0A1I7Y8N3_9BILA